MPRIGLSAVLLCALCSLLSAQASPYTPPHLPAPHGFRVFIVPDMEGMGSAVDIHEVIAGNETVTTKIAESSTKSSGLF